MKSKPKKGGGGGGGGGGEAKSSTVMIILLIYRVFNFCGPGISKILKLKFEKILKLNYSGFARNFRPQNVLIYYIHAHI